MKTIICRLFEIPWRIIFHPKCFCQKRMKLHWGGLLGPTFGCSECHVLETL